MTVFGARQGKSPGRSGTINGRWLRKSAISGSAVVEVPCRWRDIKLLTKLQTQRTTMTECPTKGLREGWLANWLITERVTGLGGSCIQLTQSDMSAHGLIVVKEDDTHIHAQEIAGVAE